MDRGNLRQNAYSGKIKLIRKNKALREKSNSPAVPMPTY